jgi:hypothetical protein
MLFVYLARPLSPVPRQTSWYLILCFAFLPFWVALLDGQTSLLLVVLYWLSLLSLKCKKDFRAGAILGMGLFRFQLVLPFALICLLRQKWKMMGGFATVASLLGLLSIVVAGPSGLLSYYQLLLHVIKHPADPAYVAIQPYDMPILRGFLSVLLTGRIGEKWTNAAVAVVSALLILFTAWRWRQQDRREGDASLGLAFAAAVAVALMTGFHLYVYDLSLLLPAVLLALGSSQWSERSGWNHVLNISIGILYLPPLYFLLSNRSQRYLLFIPLAGFAIAALGLLAKPALNPFPPDHRGTAEKYPRKLATSEQTVSAPAEAGLG